MEARELRIGNFLSVGGYIWQVDSIINGENPELYFAENTEYNHYLNAEPIPLTEKIFRSIPEMGMDLDSNFGSWFKWIKEDEGRGYAILVDCDEGWVGQKIKFIHKLQNIYFDIENKELTIKL